MSRDLRRILVLANALAALGVLPGCAAQVFLCPKTKDLLTHAVFIGSDGTPALIYDQDGHSLNTSRLVSHDQQLALQKPVLSPSTTTFVGDLDRYRHLNYNYQAYVHNIVESLRSPEHRNDRILIFIHGGRNSLAGAQCNAARILTAIDKENAALPAGSPNRIYPIFINYESADLSSYLEHLRSPRPEQRNPLEEAWTLLRPPARLVADVGAGAARVPLTLDQEIVREYATIHGRTSIDEVVVRDGLHVDYGGFEERGLTKGLNAAFGLATAPFRMAFGLLISTVAPGEWESMRRRSEFALRPPDEFSRDHWGNDYSPMSGAVGILLDALGDVVSSDRARALQDTLAAVIPPTLELPRWTGPERDRRRKRTTVLLDSLETAVRANRRVTLIGHSTGTIVASEVLRLHPDWNVDRIVFMAAACTVREFETSVLPTLRAHPDTRFYNLCLHPTAELRETCMPVIGPAIYRGSLLTWIDDYLDTPLGPVDRTMGKAENCLAAQHGWEGQSVRSRIFIRVMPYRPSVNEKSSKSQVRVLRHGEFARVRFWDERFWWPTSADGSTHVEAVAP